MLGLIGLTDAPSKFAGVSYIETILQTLGRPTGGRLGGRPNVLGRRANEKSQAYAWLFRNAPRVRTLGVLLNRTQELDIALGAFDHSAHIKLALDWLGIVEGVKTGVLRATALESANIGV